MNGPEHYLEAERFADVAMKEIDDYGSADKDAEAYHLQQSAWAQQQAQVHATLALAAATAEPIAQAYDSDYDTAIPAAWSKAIS